MNQSSVKNILILWILLFSSCSVIEKDYYFDLKKTPDGKDILYRHDFVFYCERDPRFFDEMKMTLSPVYIDGKPYVFPVLSGKKKSDYDWKM